MLGIPRYLLNDRRCLIPLPDHHEHGGAGHEFHELADYVFAVFHRLFVCGKIVGLFVFENFRPLLQKPRVVLVVVFPEFLLVGDTKTHPHELEARALIALDYLADKPALYPVGLDDDKSAFFFWMFHERHSTISFTKTLRGDESLTDCRS